MRTCLLLTAIALTSTGCGGTTASSATVPIQSFKYKPATVNVRAGGKITFLNRDAAGHTATFAAGPSNLDTGRLERGDRASLTFPKAGRFSYVCAFHAFMKGDVVVDE